MVPLHLSSQAEDDWHWGRYTVKIILNKEHGHIYTVKNRELHYLLEIPNPNINTMSRIQRKSEFHLYSVVLSRCVLVSAHTLRIKLLVKSLGWRNICSKVWLGHCSWLFRKMEKYHLLCVRWTFFLPNLKCVDILSRKVKFYFKLDIALNVCWFLGLCWDLILL